VWNQIYEVPAIGREEIPNQWIYHLGFPRPVAAMIDHQGVGGKRHATFEGNVSFFEVVTHWEPAKKLSFTIKADPEFIPQTAFDEHIIVGGRFYDVLDGTCGIEVVGGERVHPASLNHPPALDALQRRSRLVERMGHEPDSGIDSGGDSEAVRGMSCILMRDA